MPPTDVSLSVVVPAYNEARRIPGPLRTLGDYLAGQPYTSEIVVVDDGSDDDTFATVRKIGETLPVPVRALRYRRNAGKGLALKVGFRAARGERILFMDADLATSLEATESLLRALDEGFEVAIGSRKIPGASISRRQPRMREWMGRAFTALVRVLVADVSDVTCGFKAYRADCGREMFARARIHDWSFDAELLHLARHLGYRVKEVPVVWHDEAGTKVDLRRDVLMTLFGLVRIRINALRGVYSNHAPLALETESWQSAEVAAEEGAAVGEGHS